MLKDCNNVPPYGLEYNLRDHIAWLTERAWRERGYYYDAVVLENRYGQERHRAKYSEQRLQIQWLRDLVAERVTA